MVIGSLNGRYKMDGTHCAGTDCSIILRDGWANWHFKRFLGKDTPLQEFPSGNRPEQMIKSIGNLYMDEWFGAAKLKLGSFVAVCLGIIVALTLYG